MESDSKTIHTNDSTGAVPVASHTSKAKKRKKKKKPSDSSSSDRLSSAASTASTVVAGATDSSPQSTFQEELQWCISQLEIGLSRTDATKSQKQENEKYIRTLRSEKTPLPRKRQIMKSLFGNYRTRMQREPVPQQFKTLDSVPGVSSGKNSAECGGGRFFRRSVQNECRVTTSSSGEGVNGECSGVVGVYSESTEASEKCGAGFCFNFEIEP